MLINRLKHTILVIKLDIISFYKRLTFTGTILTLLMIIIVNLIFVYAGNIFSSYRNEPLYTLNSDRKKHDNDHKLDFDSIIKSIVTVSVDDGNESGSGFFINSHMIVTNNHVIQDAAVNGKNLVIYLYDGVMVSNVTILARDQRYDLALLKVDISPHDSIAPLQFQNSDDIHVGDSVYAIGEPLGLQSTVTRGIISEHDRPMSESDGASDSIPTFLMSLQTDASINQGNSGGPLIDSYGKVVGINFLIQSSGGNNPFNNGPSGSIGLGFAIQSNMVTHVIDELNKNGKAIYPCLGVQIDTSYVQRGAKIKSVDTSSKANGKLKDGDIVIEYNGKNIINFTYLFGYVFSSDVNSSYVLTVQRGSLTFKIEVPLITCPSNN